MNIITDKAKEIDIAHKIPGNVFFSPKVGR